nr:uncharacterized protein LOC111416759 [Onthophagus taurus]
MEDAFNDTVQNGTAVDFNPILTVNGSEDGNNTVFEEKLPIWVIFFYFGFVAFGGLLDLCLIFGLLRSKKRGIILIIIQLLFVDILTIILLVPEILLLHSETWIFPSNFCPPFLGGEILINSLSIYLIICLNFHVISIWNLHFHEASQGKNPLTSCNGDDSNECLVKKNETPTTSRNLTIDYRRKKTDVSIIFPCLLIWSVCLSLSVPQYTLATTLKVKLDGFNVTLCTVINTQYGDLLQHLLLSFKAIIPLGLLTLSFLLLIFKLYKSKTASSLSNAKNVLSTQRLIILCIMLTLTCFLTFLPRNVPYVMHTLAKNKTINDVESFKIPPLHNFYISEYEAILLAMLHYSSVPLRTLVCMVFLPTLSKFFQRRIFVCFKKEEQT